MAIDQMPPPLLSPFGTRLPLMVELVTVSVQRLLSIPPPVSPATPLAVLLLTVLLMTFNVPAMDGNTAA